jgi:opacity protein-like surface antigen
MLARSVSYFCSGSVIAATLLLLAHQAQAQATRYGAVNIGNTYVGASGGVIIPDKLHGNFSGAVAGSGDLSFKTGPVGTIFVGYHLDDYLAGELEAGYASFDENNFSGTLNGISGSASIDGKLKTVIGFGNVIVTPFGRSGFYPYFGGGPGVIYFDQTVNSIGGIPVNSSSKETDFAANIVAGVEAAVANGWSIGARYRFVWANTSSSTSSGGVTTKQDDFTAHVITANVTLHF